MYGDRAETAEASPVLGILLLGFTTLVLGAIVGATGFGTVGSSGYSGASISADFDRSDSEVGATVVDLRGADYVNVSVYGYGNGVKARLESTGARFAVSENGARIQGAGEIYDLEGDAVASSSGSTATLHEGQGVPRDESVRVQAVAVEGDQQRVVLDTSGSI